MGVVLGVSWVARFNCFQMLSPWGVNGWKQKGAKCYWVKKQMKRFHITPLYVDKQRNKTFQNNHNLRHESE